MGKNIMSGIPEIGRVNGVKLEMIKLLFSAMFMQFGSSVSTSYLRVMLLIGIQ